MIVLNNKLHYFCILTVILSALTSCEYQKYFIQNNETIELTTENQTARSITVSSELPLPVSSKKNMGTISDFYKHSIFVGDSIMLGFSKYLTKTKECDFINDYQIYGFGSFSVWYAINPITEDSVNPVYMGEKCSIEDLCKKNEADSIYILLGMNDIAIWGVDNTFNNYKTLISNIKKANPKIKCNILSITYIAKNHEQKNLNNQNIKKLNNLLENYCLKTKNAEYINISDMLSENGYLKDLYCSDGYIHLNNSAYNIWNKVFVDFAQKHNYFNAALEQTTEISTTLVVEKNNNSISEIENFYNDAVFVGDSITVGFSEFLKNDTSFYGKPQFLATVSLGTYHALMPLSSTNLHPKYNGIKMRLPDSVKESGAKQIYICFGINDLMAHNPETAFKTYKELIGEIKTKNPDIKFHIISTTNICSGSESNYLTNENVSKLNANLKKYCTDNDIDFIDIASALTDNNGSLARKYSSDGYVHQNNTAYEIWVKQLNDFAIKQSEES